MTDLTENWYNIEDTLEDAVSIAWDGCHKIYILMDKEAHRTQYRWGSEYVLRLDNIGADEALALLRKWYDDSCGLRFISAVRTTEPDPNEGYTHLISQFEDEEDWEDE